MKHFPGPRGKAAIAVAASFAPSGDDPSKLSLDELNRRLTPQPGKELPSQQDLISSADDKPPSRQEFVALVARVVALEEAAKPAPKAAAKKAPARKK